MALTSLWLFWAVIAAVALAGYNSMFKLVGDANMFLFLTAANAVAFISYAAILFFNSQETVSFSTIFNNKALLYGALTGLLIAIFEISCFFTLKNNAAGLSVGYGVIGVLSLLLTALIGILVFKEVINWQNAVGIGFALMSVWLLTYKGA